MVRPKKYLGQHFLTDQSIARRIAEALQNYSGKVLEIGPGKGILTGFLLQNPSIKLSVIEIDHESIDYLRNNFNTNQFNIFEGDFLKFNLPEFFDGNVALIGNFPYNISSQILFRTLDYYQQVPLLIGMFQREVARRIVSPPDCAEYGILSVLMQTFYDCEYLFTVNEGVFFPPPKVKSGVIRLVRKDNFVLPFSRELFIKLVKTAFNQRRKTLRNALLQLTGNEFNAINPFAANRAQELSVEQFIELTRLFASFYKNTYRKNKTEEQ